MSIKPKNCMSSRVLSMTEVERAWIGALIEGEGHASYRTNGQTPVLYPYVGVSNTGPEVISVLLRKVGAGSISAIWPKGLGNKLIFHWNLRRRAEVLDIVEQCKDYSMKLQKLASWLGGQ